VIQQFGASYWKLPELVQPLTHRCAQLGRVIGQRQLHQKVIDADSKQHHSICHNLHSSPEQK
jgi:hypothetical protein